MQNIVRSIVSEYLSSKTLPTASQFGEIAELNAQTKEPTAVFVTLYRGGEIIASAGRIQPLHQTLGDELLDSTLLAIMDSRAEYALQNPDDLKTTQIRVDLIPLSHRQVISRVSDIDAKKDGAIILSQNYMKAAILLPNITNVATNSDEVYFILTKKAGLDPEKITTADYVLYRFESIKHSDF